MFTDPEKPLDMTETDSTGHEDRRRRPLALPMMLVREGFFRTTRRPITIEEAHEMNRKAATRERSWF